MSKRVKQPAPAVIPTTVATGQRTADTIQSDAFDLEGQGAAETEDGGDGDVATEAEKNEDEENEKEEETSAAQDEDEEADTVEGEVRG